MTENEHLIQYVKQKTTVKSIVGRIITLIAVAAILIVLSHIPLLRNYMIILSVGIVLIASAFMRNFSSEYEYLLSDGEFFISRIYGVSKRKELFSFPISDISDIRRYDFPEKEGDVLNFSSSLSEFSPLLIKLQSGVSVVLSPNIEIGNALLGRASE